MVEILEKGGVIMGDQFKNESVRTNGFGVLHAQTIQPEEIHMPNMESLKHTRTPDVNNSLDTPEGIPKEKSEKEKWSVPESFVDTLDVLAGRRTDGVQKRKLGTLKFDLEDESSPVIVVNRIHDAIEQDILTHEEAENLLRILRQDIEKKIPPAMIPSLSINEDGFLDKKLADVTPPGRISVPEQPQNIREASMSIHIEVVPTEQLKEKLEIARKEYLGLFVTHKNRISEQKKVFELTMSGLGQQDRHMPTIPESVEYTKAHQEYREALKAVLDSMRKGGESMDALLTLIENEDLMIEKYFIDGLSPTQSRIFGKALTLRRITPLPGRFNTSHAVLGGTQASVSTRGGRLVDGIVRPIREESPEVAPSVVESLKVEDVVLTQSRDQSTEILKPTNTGNIVQTEGDVVPQERVHEVEIIKNKTPLDVVSGNSPLPQQFQFDAQFVQQRNRYGIDFHRALIAVPEGTVDFSFPIDYNSGQIMVLQKGNNLTVLLNGQRIGSGSIAEGIMKLNFIPVQEQTMFGVKSGYETAFEYAKVIIEEKKSLFKPVSISLS